MRVQSVDMTALFVAQGLPPCVREHRFHPPRRWRFDYAWPDQLVAFEYEGGVWGGQGRHVRGRGYRDDCIKYSTAAALGWCVIRATVDMVECGVAFDLLALAFEHRGKS